MANLCLTNPKSIRINLHKQSNLKDVYTFVTIACFVTNNNKKWHSKKYRQYTAR